MADNTNTKPSDAPSLPAGSGDPYLWWTFSRWNNFLWASCIVLGLFYTILHMHWFADKVGYGGEYTRLNKEQLAQVAAIYSKTADSAGNKPDYATQVRQFINTDFNQEMDETDLDSVIGYLRKCTNQEATMFMTSKRLQVKSYFWLSGTELYWEVIFWSLGGVLASLIFMLSSRHRKSVQYSDTDGPNEPYCPEEVPYQIGKLFYAPLTTLVLIFGYNYIDGDNRPDIFSSKGMLALSFLCGFFSGRVMTVINRIKEAIIPANSANNSGSDDDSGGGSSSDAGSTTGSKDKTDNSTDNSGGPDNTDGTTNTDPGSDSSSNGSAGNGGDGSSDADSSAPPPNSNTTAPTPPVPVPGGILITLQLDPVVDAALSAKLQQNGLQDASVTLEPATDGDAIEAKAAGSDPVFVYSADKVPAGSYMITASWESDDDDAVRLSANQTFVADGTAAATTTLTLKSA